MNKKIQKTEEEWKKVLTPEQYRIAREKGTEAPFIGKYVENHKPGVYTCAACGSELFTSETKFDSDCGWPSFYDVIHKGNVNVQEDNSLGMKRLEVTCAVCDAHLGHVFDDGPHDKTGKRYCINSAILNFIPKD
jgi:peptide-methionine (R)-S-oxide reductase